MRIAGQVRATSLAVHACSQRTLTLPWSGVSHVANDQWLREACPGAKYSVLEVCGMKRFTLKYTCFASSFDFSDGFHPLVRVANFDSALYLEIRKLLLNGPFLIQFVNQVRNGPSYSMGWPRQYGSCRYFTANTLKSFVHGVKGMCKNLVEKGDLENPLVIFNRTQQRAIDLNAKLPVGKSVVASSLDEAVSRADIVFTSLGDDTAMTETLDAAVAGNVKGKLFVDCSTVHPDTTKKLAKNVQEKGAEFIACPGMGWTPIEILIVTS